MSTINTPSDAPPKAVVFDNDDGTRLEIRADYVEVTTATGRRRTAYTEDIRPRRGNAEYLGVVLGTALIQAWKSKGEINIDELDLAYGKMRGLVRRNGDALQLVDIKLGTKSIDMDLADRNAGKVKDLVRMVKHVGELRDAARRAQSAERSVPSAEALQRRVSDKRYEAERAAAQPGRTRERIADLEAELDALHASLPTLRKTARRTQRELSDLEASVAGRGERERAAADALAQANTALDTFVR